MCSLIGFIFLFLFASCENPVTPPVVENNKKIVQLKEQWIQPPDYDTIVLSYVEAYNPQGNPIEKSQYSRIDGSLVVHDKWTYDEHQNVIKKTSQHFGKKTFSEESFSYEYDNNGRKVGMIEINPNSNDLLKHIYVYHEDGTYTDTVKLNAQVMAIMRYNENNDPLNGVNYQRRSRINNEYDEHGKITRKYTTYTTKRKPTDRNYKNEYDSLGNLIRVTLGRKQREYEYNENGDMVEEGWLDSGRLYRTIYYKYKYYN